MVQPPIRERILKMSETENEAEMWKRILKMSETENEQKPVWNSPLTFIHNNYRKGWKIYWEINKKDYPTAKFRVCKWKRGGNYKNSSSKTLEGWFLYERKEDIPTGVTAIRIKSCHGKE